MVNQVKLAVQLFEMRDAAKQIAGPHYEEMWLTAAVVELLEER